jgi:hypothetical protein
MVCGLNIYAHIIHRNGLQFELTYLMTNRVHEKKLTFRIFRRPKLGQEELTVESASYTVLHRATRIG